MEDKKKRIERSRAYPIVDLSEALNKIENINSNLGLTGQFNRESLAVGMGYSSLHGASARAVAALVQYGLLTRTKDQYSLSDLAKRYLIPTDDDTRSLAIIEAALLPKLFIDIYQKFEGQVIPKQFTNRLITEFGIQQKVAPDVAEIFRNTMEVAGILKDNGVLLASNKDNAPTPDLSPKATEAIPMQDNTAAITQLPNSPDQLQVLTFDLPSGITIGYSKELATAFAFGEFGTELKALDKAIANYLNESSNDE